MTLDDINANCPPDNRFQAWHEESQDTQPNTNSFSGVIEQQKTQVNKIHSLQVSQMTSVTPDSIERFLSETKCVRYVDNPQLVEGLIIRSIGLAERDLITTLSIKMDLRHDFYLVVKKNRLLNHVQYSLRVFTPLKIIIQYTGILLSAD
jgi:hypothetical protein